MSAVGVGRSAVRLARASFSTGPKCAPFGVCVDMDGVLYRGKGHVCACVRACSRRIDMT